MSTVSTSFDVVYPVRQTVTSAGKEIDHGVRQVVSTSASLVHGVRHSVYPAKVFALVYGVREMVSRSQSILYGVRVPLSAGKTFGLVYGVRARTSTDSTELGAFSSAFSTAFSSVPSSGITVEYDTGITGNTQVSKTVSIVYHTLIKPTVDEVITVPVERDSVPPQIVTTTSF